LDVKERMELCRIIEMSNRRKAYSEKIGLKNSSKFRGEQVFTNKNKAVYR